MVKRTAGVLLVLAAIFAIVCCSGCTIAKISGRGAMPLILNNPPAKTDVVEHFRVSKMKVFDYTAAYDVSEIIADKLAGSKADAVINLTIVIKSDVGCFFVNLFTLGLASARTIAIEGDLVNAPKGLSSLMDGKTILAQVTDSKDLAGKMAELASTGNGISSVVQKDGTFYILQ
jgi:hypothetical protein